MESSNMRRICRPKPAPEYKRGACSRWTPLIGQMELFKMRSFRELEEYFYGGDGCITVMFNDAYKGICERIKNQPTTKTDQ